MHKQLISLFLILGCLFVSCSQRSPVVIHETPVYKKKILIAIDAGHGGNDFGTASPKKIIKEKDLTLSTAYMLRDHLQRMGYTTVLTRTQDIFIPLSKRTEIANQRQATLFISIHYNAASNRKAEGVEIFYPESLESPQRGMRSKLLAQNILENIIQQTKTPSRGIKARNFAVIRNTSMPAVLIEGGFLTNITECSKLSNPKYLNTIAFGIAKGIDTYFTTFTFKGPYNAKR